MWIFDSSPGRRADARRILDPVATAVGEALHQHETLAERKERVRQALLHLLGLMLTKGSTYDEEALALARHTAREFALDFLGNFQDAIAMTKMLRRAVEEKWYSVSPVTRSMTVNSLEMLTGTDLDLWRGFEVYRIVLSPVEISRYQEDVAAYLREGELLRETVMRFVADESRRGEIAMSDPRAANAAADAYQRGLREAQEGKLLGPYTVEEFRRLFKSSKDKV